jgi:hypothetical protein
MVVIMLADLMFTPALTLQSHALVHGLTDLLLGNGPCTVREIKQDQKNLRQPDAFL